MRAVHFEEIEVRNKILIDVPGNGLMKFEVEEVDELERCVLCKGNVVSFFPNEDDQYILVE